jgi:hypothetical protein
MAEPGLVGTALIDDCTMSNRPFAPPWLIRVLYAGTVPEPPVYWMYRTRSVVMIRLLSEMLAVVNVPSDAVVSVFIQAAHGKPQALQSTAQLHVRHSQRLLAKPHLP